MMAIFNILLLLIVLAVFCFITFKNPLSGLALSVLFLMMFWQGVSVAYLETGAYSSEMLTTTYATGATARFAAAFLLLLAGYWAGFKIFYKSPGQLSAAYSENALTFAVLLLIASSAWLLTAVPTDLTIWRAAYLEMNPSAVRDSIFKYLPLLTFLSGLSAGFSSNSRLRLAAYVGMLFVQFVMVAFGNKFSGLVSALFPFVLAIGIGLTCRSTEKAFIRETVKRLALLLLCSGLLISRGMNLYMANHSSKPVPVVEDTTVITDSKRGFLQKCLSERILILQGGLWWVTDRNVVRNGQALYWKKTMDYVKSCPWKNPFNSLLTEKAVGKERLKYLRERYVQYTGTSPAIFYELFGPVGPFPVLLLLGFLYAGMIAYLISRVSSGSFIMVSIVFLLYMPVDNLLIDAETAGFSSWRFAAKLAILGLCEVLYANRGKIPAVNKFLF